MHLELKGEEKFGSDDQQDKMNRNFRKEEGHSKGKKRKTKAKKPPNLLPTVRK